MGDAATPRPHVTASSRRSDAVLVLAGLCDISHPFDCLVVRLLEDLQEADVQARGGEHGDLEIHGDRRSTPHLFAHRLHHLDFARHEVLGVPREAPKLPDDAPVLWLVFALARSGADVRDGGVLRARDLDDHVCSEELEGEHRLDLDVDLEPRPAQLLDDGQHAEGQIDVLGDAVRHELELAVGRHKRDGAVHVKLAELDALVEGDVVDVDARAGPPQVRLFGLCLVVEQQLVVEPKLALGLPREVALDHDAAGDFVAEDGALGRHEQVAVLDHVDEELVLPVLDALLAPANCARRLDGDARGGAAGAVLHRLAVALLGDVHLEHVVRGVLRVAVVEDLVEQLVDEDEVVAHRLLRKVAKVRLEHLDQLVQELKGERGLRVARRDGDSVHVAVLDKHEGGVVEHLDRKPAGLLAGDHLVAEGVDRLLARALAVNARDDHFALLVDQQHVGDHRPPAPRSARAILPVCWLR
mmetsp:Transcript_22180/g.73188  ORF Transcript_22180/g.73188 Transcript_22180/m.73188 type:complete len:470 (+) Transcript_22180:196-1605(+)